MTDRSPRRTPLAARLLLLLLALVSWPALAFDLDDLQAQLGQTSALQGRFDQQRYLADLDTHLDSTGHFSYQRGTRVVWVLETPVEDRLVFTPNDTGLVDDASTAAEGRRQDQVAALFLQLLDGDWQALTGRFEIALDGAADDWRVELTPRAPALRERVTRIELQGGRYLHRLTLYAANDDTLDVQLHDQGPLDASSSQPLKDGDDSAP